MRKINILIGLITGLGLAGCNLGSTTTNSSDIQTGNGSVSSGNSAFTISALTATGCLTIATNGSCTVTFNYYGSNSFLGVLTLNTLSGYTSTINSCTNVNTWVQSCTFTINNTGGSTSTALPVTIYANGQSQGIQLFSVGGGL